MDRKQHSFRRMRIWQVGFEIADLVYQMVDEWPRQELYSLSQQSTRAAASTPANIAEGSAKSSDKDFRRYLEIALGSCYELQTHLLLAKRRGFGDQEKLELALNMIDEEQKMLVGFMKGLTTKINQNSKTH
ncbi:MAG: four helix bundle protein [Bacteroidota bacterium]